jgi:radical SAM family uncharacterized protein/radical SAM-linked protein
MSKQSFLPFVSKPGRYTGGEYNVCTKQADDATLLCALVFPDLYEIGMSHQGLQILYHILNGQDGIIAERCYCPAPDAEILMRDQGVPLTSLENSRELGTFDLIGITLPHELCYTNILTVLDRAAIPFMASQRDETHPIILGGGTCAFNPEPVAEFFDAILLGDGEEAIVDIARLLKKLKEEGCGRQERLEQLATIAGIYLPHHFSPEYDERGQILSVSSRPGSPDRIKRRILADLDAIEHLKNPLVPNTRIVHDRLGIEVARGCTRGCRFCQAGITYRPVRERSVEQILELAEDGIGHSGFDEITLLSLSTGDYSCLGEVLPRLMNRFADERVSVALPSMRVGTLTPELMDEIRKVRKTGFTLAPEAGSERLRRAINKGISEEDLLSFAGNAFELGWKLIKLYFMIGLPTETKDDIDAIADLARKTAEAGKVTGRDRKRVNVSIGTFVPKPHTPFQWEPQVNISESREKINDLRAKLGRGINMKYHDPEQSYLEGVFARGDRRLASLIIKGWEKGARLDSWSDFFNLKRWQDAAGECAIDLDFYLRRRESGESLPWQHLDCGVDDQFLLDELKKTHEQEYTPDCRYHDCQKCGLCDFKTIMPVVKNRKRVAPVLPKQLVSSQQEIISNGENHFKYLVSYSRTGPVSYLGHLDFLQLILRALRRAHITTHFSQGFNPSPKVSFGPALPVGTESLAEFFLMDLPQLLTDTSGQIELLNNTLPHGVRINTIELHHQKLPQDILCSYEITLPFELENENREALETFLQSGELIVTRERKKKTSRVNLRPLVAALSIETDKQVNIDIISRSGSPGTKPLELLHHVLRKSEADLLHCQVLKTGWIPFED